MTDYPTPPAGSGCAITCVDARITVDGNPRTSADQELIRTAVEHVLHGIADNVAQREVVVDLARAGYLDIRTLTALLGVARRCADSGKALALEGANRETLDALRMTKLDQVLARHGTRIDGVPDLSERLMEGKSSGMHAAEDLET